MTIRDNGPSPLQAVHIAHIVSGTHPKTTRDKSRPLSLAICGFLFSCKKSTTYLTFDPPTRTLRSLKFFPLLLGNVFSSMAALSNFARKTYNPRHEPPVTPSAKQLLVRLVPDILAHATGRCICSVHVRFTTERTTLRMPKKIMPCPDIATRFLCHAHVLLWHLLARCLTTCQPSGNKTLAWKHSLCRKDPPQPPQTWLGLCTSRTCWHMSSHWLHFDKKGFESSLVTTEHEHFRTCSFMA